MTTRRDFLQRSFSTVIAASLPMDRLGVPVQDPAAGFLDLLRPPDAVVLQTADGERAMHPAGSGTWQLGDARATFVAHPSGAGRPDALRIRLSAPQTAVTRIHARWRGNIDTARLLLGDAWERGYGDLEWRVFVPDRVMPWYFATWDGKRTHAYGVLTGANALCYWHADPAGISLWADVRAGGVGVRLGERTLDVCDVVCRAGDEGESPFAALHAFCRRMCPRPRLPAQPVYGHNDWYWAYGRNSAASVLADARHIVDLSPGGDNRPFAVIDDGWQPEHDDHANVGVWDHGNGRFGDMAALAGKVRAAGARPGIWIRPLLAPHGAPDGWRLPREARILDPTIPEVRRKVSDDIARLRQWGFDLVKHDYTTFDIFGRWGFQMASSLTKDGWTFAAGPARTTAEVIKDLYATIRDAAGDSLVIGCNTVSHLSAGVFEICRVGDDTSGREWSRTRRMGVNTLAFRGAHHGAFYTVDPDCVGVTTAIPWRNNRLWLDLLARSGTMLFVSLAPDALGTEVRQDLRAALAVAAQPQPLAEPLDWQHTTWPARWRLMSEERSYDWMTELD